VTKYDVIVAGSGPSGSMAARRLAERGASVLLLDKQKFPRDKPCGGGVTLRAASVQEIDLTPVIERTIYGARFSLRLGDAFDRRFDKPLTYMTQRCRLDQHLAECAAESGADLHDGEALREIDACGSGPGVAVRTVLGVDDAALSAAGYLCWRGKDLATPRGWITALRAYNNSGIYARSVRDWATAYAAGHPL